MEGFKSVLPGFVWARLNLKRRRILMSAKRIVFILMSFVLVFALMPMSQPVAQEPDDVMVQPVNLIRNGGFEQWGPDCGKDEWPLYWTVGQKWEAPGEFFPMGGFRPINKTSGLPRMQTNAPQGAHSGSFALYMGTPPGTNPNQPTWGYAITRQIVPLNQALAGARFELSFWAYARNSWGNLVTRAYVWFLDDGMLPLQYPTPPAALAIVLPTAGVAGYTQYRAVTAAAPAEARYAEIQIGQYSWGGSCIDDVVFMLAP
jgi:hypothetical protein